MNTRYEIDRCEQKKPPNSMQAEQSVLGSLMMDNETWNSIANQLVESDFYRRNHQLIFRVIDQLAEQQMPFDVVTLSDSLRNMGELDSIGGLPYLIMLVEDTPTAANILSYVKIVKEKSHLRDLIRIGTEITKAAFDGNIDAAQSKAQGIGGVDERPEAQEWQSDLSADIDFMIPAHFGIAADIQRWILDTSVKRQPAIALAATLSILSVVVGRQINFNGIKGNIMSVCLAGSGHGKDHPLKCAEIILDKVGLGDNVYAQVASGAALFEAVHATPSCLLQIDEMGHYLSSINSKGANPFLKEVMPMITRFYTDASTHFTDKGRKAESKGKKIEEPNLSLIGMTTENQIIETMRTSEVSDGSLARFLIMYGEKGTQIQTTRLSVRDVPDGIIDGLMMIMDKHGRDNFGFTGSKAIEVSESYQNAFNELSVRMNDKANELGADENSSNAMFEPFYHRVAVRSAQIALVIDQCQNIEVLKWAELLTVKTTEMFTKKFKHLAADNENEKMAKTVERAIVESGKNGITKSQLYDRTRKVSTIQKKMILDDLIESGKVFTDSRTEKGKQRAVTFYFWKAKKR